MNALPTRIGALDLIRRLGSGGGTETFEGRRVDGDHGRVFVRRVLPEVLAEPGAREAIETRVRDLMGVRHPFLVPVLDVITTGQELLIVEQWVEAVSTACIVAWCREHQASVPHNVFLNLSTQICNGIEALHGRPGKASGNPNVLHMALRPSALFVNLDGRILLGGYGLARAPSLVPGPLEQTLPAVRAAYLSPEQADTEQKLIPASDIFSLASVLYELLTLDPLFAAESTGAVLQRLHRAEITTQLLGIKDLMPGLDKVLYRALSSSPRHRYQRAFVLREDLRGLMAGYSFASIADDTRRFLEPIAQAAAAAAPVPATPSAPGPESGFEDKASTRIDPDPTSTAAFASQALAERILREQRGERPAAPSPAPMPQSFPAPRGPAPSSTAAWVAQAQGKPLPPTSAGPTIAPLESTPVPVAAPTPAVAPVPAAAPVQPPAVAAPPAVA
ncbi:MAG: protein kinase, partial [Pseudomonadota bacterium]